MAADVANEGPASRESIPPLDVEARLDTGHGAGTASMANHARHIEELGFDRIFTTEGRRDPFLPLAVASAHTSTIQLGTAIAVAFARSPMTTAVAAHEVNLMSNGRFRLGLGSQIEAHITRRFAMPWHGAAKQMREFIAALGAIWDNWFDGAPLRFEGDFYHHTLMTPDFTPPTSGLSRPPVLLAAVGPRMLQVAGEVADGVIVHPFCTEHYLKEVVVSNVQSGLQAQQRSLDNFEIHYPIFIVTGADEAEFERSKAAVKANIGFCGSTPAYKRVLDAHGWGDLQPKLRQLTKDNKWDRLGDLVTDEVLETFAAVGEPAAAAAIARERVQGVANSVVLDATLPPHALNEQMAVLRQSDNPAEGHMT